MGLSCKQVASCKTGELYPWVNSQPMGTRAGGKCPSLPDNWRLAAFLLSETPPASWEHLPEKLPAPSSLSPALFSDINTNPRRRGPYYPHCTGEETEAASAWLGLDGSALSLPLRMRFSGMQPPPTCTEMAGSGLSC